MKRQNYTRLWAVLITLSLFIFACSSISTTASTITFTPAPQQPTATGAAIPTSSQTVISTSTAIPAIPLFLTPINADSLDDIVLLTTIDLGEVRPGGSLSSLEFSRDSSLLAATSYDGWTYQWSIPALEELIRLQKVDILISKVFPYKNNQVLIADQTRDGVNIRDLITGQPLAELQAEVFNGGEMPVTLDGDLIATNGIQEVFLWDLPTSTQIHTYQGEWSYGPVVYQAPRTALISPDNSLIVAALSDSSIIWNMETEERILDIDASAFDFSSDGNFLAAINKINNQLVVFDTTTWQQVQAIFAGEFQVREVLFSQDGALLISYSPDGSIAFWDWVTGTKLQTLTAFTGTNMNENRYGFLSQGFVGRIRLSPDETLLVTSHSYGGVYLQFWGIP